MKIQEWGNATWYLFHTLSYKLNVSDSEHAKDLLNVFVGICDNLPCPICRKDAVMMLKGANKNLVTTKSDLSRFMWQFHNLVNKKLGKPEITFDVHNAKYEKANTNNVIAHYIRVMSKKMRNMNAMADTMTQQQNVQSFIIYMRNNIHRFNA